jgi:hypothetical protein
VPDSVESGWAYDAANQLIGGGIRDNRFYAFDPIARHWQERVIAVVSDAVSEVGSVAYHALDYAPLDNVFIFLSDAGGGGADRTWAYRFAGAALFADGFESGDVSAW